MNEPPTFERGAGCHTIQAHFYIPQSRHKTSLWLFDSHICLLWPFGTFNFVLSLPKTSAVAKHCYLVSVPHKLVNGAAMKMAPNKDHMEACLVVQHRVECRSS